MILIWRGERIVFDVVHIAEDVVNERCKHKKKSPNLKQHNKYFEKLYKLLVNRFAGEHCAAVRPRSFCLNATKEINPTIFLKKRQFK